MPPEPADADHRAELTAAVRRTVDAGSARVRYAMEANPPHLADDDHGEGIVDVHRRRAAVSYFIGHDSEHVPPVLEQVIDRDVTYLRVGGPQERWERAQLGDGGEFILRRRGRLLDLLDAPGGPTRFWLEAWVDGDGHVRRITTSDREPDADGSLRSGTVRTIVEFDDLGAPAVVDIPCGVP